MLAVVLIPLAWLAVVLLTLALCVGAAADKRVLAAERRTARRR